MKIVFLTCAGKSPHWLELIEADYFKKMSFWFNTESQILDTKKIPREDKERKINEESKKFLSFIEKTDFVVLCHERGKSLDTKGLAAKLNSWLCIGKKRLIFLVGGAYGVSKDVEERADFLLSLSSLTFNHHLAMAVILEQIYRATTVIKGVPYHNE